MTPTARVLARSALQIVRRLSQAGVVERMLVRRTQDKPLTNFWTRLLAPVHAYPRGSIRSVTRNGTNFELDISDYIQYILYFGLHVESRDALYNAVRDGMYIFDIGANIGETLLNLARLNPNGRVFGFEPVPLLYERALRNIALNGHANIDLRNVALSNRRGTLFFDLPPNRNLGSVNMSFHRATKQSAPVTAITLDEFVADEGIPRVDLIKIDAEGFETYVLKGAQRTIKSYRPLLFVEIIDEYLRRAGSSASMMLGMLSDWGYQIRDAADMHTITSGETFLPGQHYDALCWPTTTQPG